MGQDNHAYDFCGQDFWVQVNAIRFLTDLIDKEIL